MSFLEISTLDDCRGSFKTFIIFRDISSPNYEMEMKEGKLKFRKYNDGTIMDTKAKVLDSSDTISLTEEQSEIVKLSAEYPEGDDNLEKLIHLISDYIPSSDSYLEGITFLDKERYYNLFLKGKKIGTFMGDERCLTLCEFGDYLDDLPSKRKKIYISNKILGTLLDMINCNKEMVNLEIKSFKLLETFLQERR